MLIIKFVLVGALNTLFGYAVYSLFVLIGFQLWIAVIASNILAVVFNFMTYGRIVFQNARLSFFMPFLVVNVSICIINYMLLEVLVRLGLGPILAQGILVPFLAFLGFILMRLYVFRDNKIPDKESKLVGKR